jgi:hypothetical protein
VLHATPRQKQSHPSFFFPQLIPTEYQQFTTHPSSKHKKIAPFIFTFATLAGNEDKHRNQAGITKLRVPRFSTALSFAVPPMAAGRHRLLFAIQMQRA